MDKKIILIIILLVLAFMGMIMHNNNKKKQLLEKNFPKQETQTQNEPNPIDYFAPGYSNAQDKIQKLKNIRQQSLEENQKDIDNILNPAK